jgi:sugar/nucleoside kinase (ribokinase family)
MAGSSIGRGPVDPHAGRGPLLVAGAATRDVDERDPRGWRLGGGVTYGSLAAARLGVKVRAVMGLDEQAANAPEIDLLRSAGVELEVISLRRGPVFESHQSSAGRVLVARQVSDRLPADRVPAGWRASAAFLLAPVADELDEEWLGLLPSGSLVALAWQGLVRRLVAGRPVEHRPLQGGPLLRRADIAAVSAEDAAAGGVGLAQLLMRPGQQLAVTHGPHGAIHVERLPSRAGRGSPFRFRTVPAMPAAVATDPTGAGDVFLAAWVAASLAGRATGSAVAPWRQLALAAAAASLTAEAGSLAQLPDLGAVCGRLLRQPAAGDPGG